MVVNFFGEEKCTSETNSWLRLCAWLRLYKVLRRPVSGDYNNEDESSCDEDDSESDCTDAVKDRSCQQPVPFLLVLLLIFEDLLFLAASSSLQYVADLFQQLFHWIVHRCCIGRRWIAVIYGTVVAVVSGDNALTLCTKNTRFHWLRGHRLHAEKRR